MKKYPALLCIGLLLGCQHQPNRTALPTTPSAPPVATNPLPSAPIFDLPHAERRLTNGLYVLAVKAPTPGLVSLQIPVQTGSRNEVEAGKSGFAHFFEHMMFRGTARYPAEVYGALIKDIGGDQNAYTTDDYTNYYLNFTSADLAQVLEVEADRFQHLDYSEDQFRTEAQAVKGEYLKNSSNPIQKALERLRAISFDQHPYRHTTMGFFEDIENMPEQMPYAREFFTRWYRPEYTSVIVIGDIDLQATLDLVERHWGGWAAGNYHAEIPLEPESTAARYEHVRWDAPTLPWILHAFRAPALTIAGPDSAALALAAELYFGESSALNQRLLVTEQSVQRLLALSADNRDPGLFVIAAQLSSAERAASVTAAIDDTLASMRAQPLDAKRVLAAKSHLKYQFASAMSSADGIGGVLAQWLPIERDLDTLNRYYQRLDAVTAEDIRAVANQVFQDRNRRTISLANAATLPGAESKLALDALSRSAALLVPESAVVVPEFAAFASAYPRHVEDLYFPIFEQASDSPLVDVALVFRSGAADDPAGKKGLAALTARLLTDSATARRSLAEIKQRMYPLAADFSAQVDKQLTRFSGQVHRDNLAAWYPLIREMLLEPGFAPADFARVKAQQLTELRVSLRGNNDEELAKEKLYEDIYGSSHPYGTLNLGHGRDLESITLEDVKQFYQDYYASDRLAIGLAGDRNNNISDRLTEDMLGLPAPRLPAAAPPPVPTLLGHSATIIAKDSAAVAVSFGWPIALHRGDADWLALWLVRSWLGEHRNSSAQLYNRIREVRGMNYGDYAYIEYFPNGMSLMQQEPNLPRTNDLFQVWLRPLRNNNDALFATRVALSELQQLYQHGLSAAAFEATRRFLGKNVLTQVATQTRRLGYFIDSQYFGIDEFPNYVSKGLAELDLDQVNAVIRKYLNPANAHFVFVSADAKDLAAALVSDRVSPLQYNTAKPADLLKDDRRIQALPLAIAADHIHIEPVNEVFE